MEEITDWPTRWFNRKNLPDFLEEDFRIREFLEKELKEAGVQSIEIERLPGKVNIIINSARPALIIGRRGERVEKLKSDLDKILKKIQLLKRSGGNARQQLKTKKIPKGKSESKKVLDSKELKIEIREVRNPWAKASLVCQLSAQQIEKRLPHRRVMKQSLGKIMGSKEVKGARIELSGRLGGSEIARREWLKEGRLPRQTIRADIDYARCGAYCTYGVIGIKVWIYKGDKL